DLPARPSALGRELSPCPRLTYALDGPSTCAEATTRQRTSMRPSATEPIALPACLSPIQLQRRRMSPHHRVPDMLRCQHFNCRTPTDQPRQQLYRSTLRIECALKTHDDATIWLLLLGDQ